MVSLIVILLVSEEIIRVYFCTLNKSFVTSCYTDRRWGWSLTAEYCFSLNSSDLSTEQEKVSMPKISHGCISDGWIKMECLVEQLCLCQIVAFYGSFLWSTPTSKAVWWSADRWRRCNTLFVLVMEWDGCCVWVAYNRIILIKISFPKSQSSTC